jgi:hypothetical protein
VEDDTEVTIVERVLAEMDPEHQKVLHVPVRNLQPHEIAKRLSLLGTVKTRSQGTHHPCTAEDHDDRRPRGELLSERQ